MAGGDARPTNLFIMQAAILAAGLGTRLRPLTDTTPKALVPVLNRPLLGVILAQLQDAGAPRVAVNTHHLGDQVQAFLKASAPPGLTVLVRPEAAILGTGGGLRSLAGALEDAPFLAINADILTDLDLAKVIEGHDREALATLVLHDCPRFNHVWLDQEGRVAGVGTPPPPNHAGPPLAYTGLQVVSPRMLAWLPKHGPADLVSAWRQAIAQGGAWRPWWSRGISGRTWAPPGPISPPIDACSRGLARGCDQYFPDVKDPLVGEGTILEAGVTCAGGVCLGRQVRVGRGARLKNTVVWDEAQIDSGVSLEDCVVGRGTRVRASARQQVIV